MADESRDSSQQPAPEEPRRPDLGQEDEVGEGAQEAEESALALAVLDDEEDDGGNALDQRREGIALIIKETPAEQLEVALEPFQPSEVAEALEEEPLARQLAVLRGLSHEKGLEIFDYLTPTSQGEILGEFREWRAARYLQDMAPDQRADLFAELPEHLQERFMALLTPEERQDVKELMTYPENTAGGRMTSEFAHVTPDMTVAQVLEAMRRDFRNVEMIYYVYVLDEGDHLLGLLSLRYVLLAEPTAIVRDIMHPNVVRLRENLDQEVVAQELALYDFVAMPVVDADNKMLGIVTFDDVVDVLESEAREDQDLFAGMSPSQDEYVDQTVGQGLRQRLPWLAAFLLLSSGSTFVLSAYEHQGYISGFFKGVIILLPMVMAMAGNAATQTATLVIRSLNVRDIQGRDVGRIIGRELVLGLLMGLCLAAPVFLRAYLAAHDLPWLLGMAMCGSIVIVLGLATGIGAALPMGFKGLGLDPAVMSSPFIATFIDIVTVVLSFQIAIFLWRLLAPLPLPV